MINYSPSQVKLLPEIESLDGFQLVPAVDEASAITRPPGSLGTAAAPQDWRRDEPDVSDTDVLGRRGKEVISFTQSEITPLGRRWQ